MLVENRDYTDKTSLLIERQFPAYIRDNPDYANFVSFVRTYYEWAEQQNEYDSDGNRNPNYNFVHVSHNLLWYADIDRTLDEYIDFYMSEFMPDFPTDCLADKRKLIKISRTLYQNRGIPDSYVFMFRALYDDDVMLYNHYPLVFKPSNGTWVQSKVLTFLSYDNGWEDIRDKTVFGRSSGGYASILRVVRSPKGYGIHEATISNPKRNFINGEDIIIVDGLFRQEGSLSGIILSQLDKVVVEDAGAGYREGDPIVFYGGISKRITNASPAKAHVSKTSASSIEDVNIMNMGEGYLAYDVNADPFEDGSSIRVNDDDNIVYNYNTELNISRQGSGSGAILKVDFYDDGPDTTTYRKIDNVFVDAIEMYVDVSLSNANFGEIFKGNPSLDDVIVNLLNRISVDTYGIKHVAVESPGSRYSTSTEITPLSTLTCYFCSRAEYEAEDDHDRLQKSIMTIPELGVLGDVEIRNGGTGYEIGDYFIVEGGTGEGAYLRVTTVNSVGTITGVEWFNPNPSQIFCPAGGIGYNVNNIPSLVFTPVDVSDQASGGVYFSVVSILGENARIVPTSSTYGAIEEITVDDYGFGYFEKPKVSPKVIDIVVRTIPNEQYTNTMFEAANGYTVYQTSNPMDSQYNPGDLEYIGFIGQFDSKPEGFTLNAEGLEVIRCFDYSGVLVPNEPIYWVNGVYQSGGNTYVYQYTDINEVDGYGFQNGSMSYGNGMASLDAIVTNGVSNSYGFFKDKKSQPSTPSQLIQSTIYNDYTYRLITNHMVEDYKDSVLKLLRPSGTQVYPLYELNSDFDIDIEYGATTYLRSISSAEIIYDADGRMIVVMYGDVNTNSGLVINFYRNGRLVKSAQIGEIITTEESFTTPDVWSFIPPGVNAISTLGTYYGRTLAYVDVNETSEISNIMYVKLSDSINGNMNIMYLQKIPASYAVATGIKPEKISDIIVVGDVIRYCGNTYKVVEINDDAEYIMVKRNNEDYATAYATLGTGDDAGKVVSITVMNKGSGYNEAPSVVVSPPAVYSASASASVTDGVVTVDVSDGGFGYDSDNPPVVTIEEPDVKRAVAHSEIVGVNYGQLRRILVDDGGYGYDDANPPSVYIGAPDIISDANSRFQSVQATATATVVNGVITGITVTELGSGYTTPPVVTVAPPEKFRATATATVVDGAVTGITVDPNPYTRYRGYTDDNGVHHPIVTVEAPLVDRAKATAIIGSNPASADYGKVTGITVDSMGSMYHSVPDVTLYGDNDTVPARIEADIENGIVVSLHVVYGGSNYVTPPVITIQPPSSGNPAVVGDVIIEDGAITSVSLSSGGSGYTTPPKVMVPPANGTIVDTFPFVPEFILDTPSPSHPDGDYGIYTDSKYTHTLFFRFTAGYDGTTATVDGRVYPVAQNISFDSENGWICNDAYSIDSLVNPEGVYDSINYNGIIYTVIGIEKVHEMAVNGSDPNDSYPHNVFVGYNLTIEEYIADLDVTGIIIKRVRKEDYISLINNLDGCTVRVEGVGI